MKVFSDFCFFSLFARSPDCRGEDLPSSSLSTKKAKTVIVKAHSDVAKIKRNHKSTETSKRLGKPELGVVSVREITRVH